MAVNWYTEQSYWLDELLKMPRFPQTEQDAKNLLRFVRSQRDECQRMREAAEQSVHQCILHLQILQRDSGGTNNVTIRRLADLECRRKALAKAEQTRDAAALRVGDVRALLRDKDLPLVFPNDTEFRGFPPRPGQIVSDGHRSDDGEYSDSPVSESGSDPGEGE
jgi:hypothetical protein